MKRILLILLACSVPALVLLGCWYRTGAGLPELDEWDIATIDGQRIGRTHTTVTHAIEGGKTVIKAAEMTEMNIIRGGQVTEMTTDCRDTETPDGRLIDFEATVRLGAVPMRTTGKVVGNHLEMKTESQGTPVRQTVDWPEDAGGFLAPVLSLRRAPMKPGEKRTVKHLNFDGHVYVMELAAEKEEVVDLWNDRDSLLKVNMVEHVDLNIRDTTLDMMSALWINSAGDILKLVQMQLNAVYFRVPPEVGAMPIEASYDLLASTDVKLARPILGVHDAKLMRYRIHLEGGDPAAAFPAGPAQEVKRIDEHTAELTVRAVRPDTKEAKGPTVDAPTDDDLSPNNFIQSDDPLIVAQAKEAAGGETDPWKQAVALEAYVHRVMNKEEFFSQAFATAAEAAKNRKGDCKAHAVYVAALARALKIPARVAVGLVYVPQSQAFGGHMWTEVYVRGRWIGLDGTIGKGGIGGGHLKLSQSSLAHGSTFDVLLSMLKVIGRLKIEVVDSE